MSSRALGAEYFSHLPSANFSVVTPYLLPPGGAKKVNIGDGFILDSTVRLLGFQPAHIFSSRAPLSPRNIEQINAGSLLVVAGANILKDDLEIFKGCGPHTLEAIRVPIALCGIGHHGQPESTREGLNAGSVALVRTILARCPSISVRCEGSKRYLDKSLADQAGDRVLMTSCPVAFPLAPQVDDFRRKQVYEHLVVTVTDRLSLESQLPVLETAVQLFAAASRTLALHQDHGNRELWALARARGFEVFRSDDYRDFARLYDEADIHFGNRIHAHLKMLSLGKRSFLSPLDLRHMFFAESLDFPLMPAGSQAQPEGYDFQRFAARRRLAQGSMSLFMQSARAVLG
jgi:hypothetical protein